MPAIYLSAAEQNAYGVSAATAPQILAASTLVDAYLKRPEGLMWMPDYAGSPCYMAGLTPTFSMPLTQTLSPGVNVVVPVANVGMLSMQSYIGEVVIIDRASAKQGQPGVCEACVIGAVGPNSITLNSVVNSHTIGVSLDFGLVIREQKTLPADRSIVRVGSWPIVRLISGVGSYRYGRRSQQQAGMYAEANLLQFLQTFGGPPAWTQWGQNAAGTAAADFNAMTNEIWVPSGIYLDAYSDVRVYYVAGYSQANIPSIIKQATANIILAGINTAEMAGGIKMARAGDTALMRFENSVIDEDMKMQLAPYRARAYA